MVEVVVTMVVMLLVGLAVVAFIALPIFRPDEVDPLEVAQAQVNLAPWEIDQRLPVAPSALTTASVPVVPLPSAQVLTIDDVPAQYPTTGRGTHRWAREFGLPLKWPGPRHAR